MSEEITHRLFMSEDEIAELLSVQPQYQYEPSDLLNYLITHDLCSDNPILKTQMRFSLDDDKMISFTKDEVIVEWVTLLDGRLAVNRLTILCADVK